MELDEGEMSYYDFENHPFDKSRNRCKNSMHKLDSLSKPKGITCGGKGIRQFLVIDETKLNMEQCFGKKIKLDEC